MKHKSIHKVLAIIVAIVMLLALLVPLIANADTSSTPDIKGHWAEQTINRWKYYGIVADAEKGKFRPDNKMLRKDFAVLLNNLFKYTSVSVNSFSDLDMTKDYTLPMLKLNAAGILKGDSGKMRPESAITREEATVMLCRAFSIEPSEDKLTFIDSSSVSDWAYKYVAALTKLGYIQGSGGQFNPKGQITRAQAITIIDNIIKAYYNKSGSYISEYGGNGFVAVSGVTIDSSTISGDLYISPGNRGGRLTIIDTVLLGNIIALAPSQKIEIKDDSDIQSILVKSTKVNIVGADLVDEITIDNGIKGVVIEGVPKKLIVKPGAEFEIDKLAVSNTTDKDIVYNKDKLVNEVAQDKGYITGGPKVSLKSLLTTSDNDIIAKNISISTSGDSDIEEVGVIYNKSDIIPTMYEYDGKAEFTGDIEGTNVFEVDVTTQDEGTTWVYRAYAINENGKVGYSSPITVKSYSYEIIGNVVETRTERDSSGKVKDIINTFEVFIHGTNIPDISKVVALSSDGNGLDDDYVETGMKQYAKYYTSDYEKVSYKADIKMPKDSDGDIEEYRYYGYRVEFSKDVGAEESFPTFTKGDSYTEDDIDYIETGDAYFIGDRTILVSGNVFEEGPGVVMETGVVLLPKTSGTKAPSKVSNSKDWLKYKAYSGSGSLKEEFDVEIKLSAKQAKEYYYAAYVKTSTKTTYGDIKSVESPLTPIYGGVKDIDISSNGKSATIELKVYSNYSLSKSASTIVEFLNETDDELVDKYDSKSLSAAYSSYSDDILKLNFTGLEKGKKYKVILQLENSKGSAPEIEFKFSTL